MIVYVCGVQLSGGVDANLQAQATTTVALLNVRHTFYEVTKYALSRYFVLPSVDVIRS